MIHIKRGVGLLETVGKTICDQSLALRNPNHYLGFFASETHESSVKENNAEFSLTPYGFDGGSQPTAGDVNFTSSAAAATSRQQGYEEKNKSSHNAEEPPAKPEDSGSTFVDILPTEIRIMILEYLLVLGLKILDRRRGRTVMAAHCILHPEILRTCKITKVARSFMA